MIHTGNITVDGETVVLLILPPDWSRPVRVTGSIPVVVDESVTGVQERRADAFAPRWGMTYRAYLEGADLQQLRTVLGALGDKRVAVPFWPDAVWSDVDWDARLMDGMVYVGWDGGINGIDDPATWDHDEDPWPEHDQQAALMVGRVRATIDAITPASAAVELAFTEESSYGVRVSPRLSGDPPTGWSSDWELDWSRDPREDQRNLEDYDNLGRGREPVVEGEPVRVWRQRASLQLFRDETSELIAFWAACRAGHTAFDLPSALQPGSETPTAPHEFDSGNGRVRFSGRSLDISFEDPAIADIVLQFEQQIELEGEADPALPSCAYLYDLEHNGSHTRLTDWESTITALAQTWTPARVEHGRIRQSLKPQNEDCEVTVALDDAPVIEPLLRAETESPVNVRIYEMELPAGTPQMLFSGSAWKARGIGRKVRITAAAFGGAMRAKVPRFIFSTNCNHTLFSTGCARRATVQMDRDAWEGAGEFVSQWPDNKVAITNVSFHTGAPSPMPAHYFSGGWLTTGTGSARQTREVSGSWYDSVEDVLLLMVTRALREDLIGEDQQVKFWPGCDGQYSTCKDKFDNTQNFGGFPFQPAWIKEAATTFPSGGK